MNSVRRLASASLGAAATLIGPAVFAQADWPPTGAPVAPGFYDEQYPFTLCTDGAGGIFVGWFTYYVSRLTSDGDVPPGWPLAISGYTGPTTYHIVNLPDGAGGMFEVFNAKDCVAHCGADPAERRVLRLTAEGALSPGWPEHGVPVGGGFGPLGFGAGDAGRTTAATDGNGGLIVAWGRHVGWTRRDPVELRVQRMDGSGAHLWGDSGRVVRTATFQYPLHVVASDERGGAILFWLDERAPHLFAQRISPEGEPQWSANGLALAGDSVAAFAGPEAITDGSRGAVVAWFGAVAGDTGIFAIRATAGGGMPWRKPLLVQRGSRLDGLQIVVAGNGDLILAWRDAGTPGNETIHAQRITHGGKLEWGRGGVPVCAAQGHKDYLGLASDDFGGAYVAWGDTRPAGEVYATHLDRAGNTVSGWDRDGTPLCPPVAAVWEVRTVDDGAGNAVVAWADERLGTPGIPFRVTQAMRLFPHGPATRAESLESVVPKLRALLGAASRPAAPGFAMHGLQPNPGPVGAHVSFALPDASPAVLELYDVTGRRVWSREVGDLGAGEHAVPLADGVWIPQGVYVARLTRNREVLTTRMAIVR